VSAPRFTVPLSISFILAVLAALCAPWFVWPVTRSNELTGDLLWFSALVLGPAWAILAFNLIRRYGKAALWVLIGLPLALGCTGLMSSFFLGCFIGDGRGCL
jgi:hypothetical protein